MIEGRKASAASARFRRAGTKLNQRSPASLDVAQRAESGLRVSVADGAGRPVRVPGLASWLTHIAPKRTRGTVTVALVSSGRIRALNRQYRGIDEITDVLSFATTQEDRRGARLPFLGDVVIATGVARRQARDAGHSIATEYRILALHGLLHLLGYHHEHDDGQMARVERALRRRGCLGRGLIERGGIRHGKRTSRRPARSPAIHT